MRIAIIGTGHVATALARWWAGKHDVFLASRDPADKSGLPVPVAGYEALKTADVIVSALPGAATIDTLNDIGAGGFGDKLLVDVSNAVNAQFQLAYPNSSLAAAIQTEFPNLRVVKAFNTFNTSVMTNPGVLPQASDAFVSGNDDAAKAVVVQLHADLGWDPPWLTDSARRRRGQPVSAG